MNKQKLLYVISNVTHSKGFEWTLEFLSRENSELHVILLNGEVKENDLADFLKQQEGIILQNWSCTSKKDIPGLIWKTFRYIKKQKITIVHSHLFEGSIVGTTAGRLARVKKNIYTRHHSTYHHDYFPNAVKYDKWVNKMASEIVAVSSIVEEVLEYREGVRPEKITVIPHGFDIDKFENIQPERIRSLKKNYQLENHFPVIGVVSRYEELKGIEYVIEAFSAYLKEHSDAKLVLANAGGSYEKNIKEFLQQLPEQSYVEIPFEKDNIALFKSFDRFIHVPVDRYCEAYGQVYVEALLAGIPSVYTISGIANDFVKDQENAFVVPYKNSTAIYHALKEIDEKDEVVKACVENGKIMVRQLFSVHTMIKSLCDLYQKI